MYDERKRILLRRSALDQERSSWFSHWREISDYLMPRTGRFLVKGERNRGDKRHNKIYDSHGTWALRVLAAGMMAGMTSPARPWFKLETPDKQLNEYEPVKEWLADLAGLMRDIFSRSNTYRSLHMLYEELGAYNTAADILLPSFKNVIHHHSLTAGEYFLATDAEGTVNTLYREFEMTVLNCVEEFGLDNCSQTIRSLYEQGKGGDNWVKILHVVEPRPYSKREPGRRDARNMPFKSCYIELDSSEDKYLREGGFKDFPGLCPRWHCTGGDVYGNGPGMEALGDVKQLQHGQLRKAQGIDYKVQPPLYMPTALRNAQKDTLPGGVTYVDTTSAIPPIRSAFDVNIDLNAQIVDIQDVRERISRIFYADLFLMLSNEQRANITATEVAERHEEKLLMLGPVLERLHNELLSPLIDVTFTRVIEAGLLPPPPPELDGMDLKIEFISTLAQAQRAVGVASVDRLLGTLSLIAPFKPEVVDKIDTDQMVDHLSDLLGVDPSIIVADDQVALVRQNRAQAQQAAVTAQLVPQAAKAAKDLAGADTTGKNALTDMLSRLQGYSNPTVAPQGA